MKKRVFVLLALLVSLSLSAMPPTSPLAFASMWALCLSTNALTNYEIETRVVWRYSRFYYIDCGCYNNSNNWHIITPK